MASPVMQVAQKAGVSRGGRRQGAPRPEGRAGGLWPPGPAFGLAGAGALGARAAKRRRPPQGPRLAPAFRSGLIARPAA